MPTKTVNFYREPSRSTPDPATLDIDLVELSLAAAKETLQTRMHVDGWLSLFSNTLSSSSKLIWRDDGLGQGRELKRSFSNILGRFIARHYLESNEGILELIPIEGNHMKLGKLTVKRKDGLEGDMPDWFGCSNTDLVVAEAKGSHDKADWGKKAKVNKAKPATLQKAQEQIDRVEILQSASRTASPIVFKGWTVGSRWGTETNNLEPWLMAIDPKQGEEPLGPQEFEEAQQAIVRHSNFLMLKSMGFSFADEMETDDFPLEQYLTADRTFPIDSGDGAPLPEGFHAIAGPFGLMPLNSRRDIWFLRLAQRLPAQTALLSISRKRLEGNANSTETERRGNLGVARNGFSLRIIDRETRFRTAD